MMIKAPGGTCKTKSFPGLSSEASAPTDSAGATSHSRRFLSSLKHRLEIPGSWKLLLCHTLCTICRIGEPGKTKKKQAEDREARKPSQHVWQLFLQCLQQTAVLNLQGGQFSPPLNSSIGSKTRSLTVLESVSFEVLSVVLACYLEQHRISLLTHPFG